MKIIDLFNKIVKGEEVPKKIKYQNKTFELDDRGIYLQTDEDCGYKTLLNYVNATSDLYYKVEIIEEDKEIEEIDVLFPCDKFNGDVDGFIFIYNHNLGAIKRKLSEIIKEVNELKRGKENE